MSEKIVIKSDWYRDNLPIESQDENAIKAINGFIKNKKIKTIGILGDYGSGKSSLINALKKDRVFFILKGLNYVLRKDRELLILKVPNYISKKEEQQHSEDNSENGKALSEKVINDINGRDCKAEVRKSITLQLLAACKDDTKKNNIQRKLLIHNYQKTSLAYMGLIICIVLSSLLLLIPEYLGEHISFIERNIEILTKASIIIFIISIILVILNITKYIKNERWTKISLSKISLNKEQQSSYLDYDLETIITLINTWKGKKKNRIVVIEDVDRFGDLSVFQELTPIIHACLNVKFIIPVKEEIFEGEEQMSKYFDATYTMLPVNDKMKFQEHVETILHEQDRKLAVDTSLLITTTPHIKDYRTFNLVYNRYLTLVDNYQKMTKVISKDELNTLYSIAVLQVLIPSQIKNTTLEETSLSIYLEKLFKKDNINKHFTSNYNKTIENINKNIESLKRELEEIKLDYATFNEFEEDEIKKIVNEMLFARIHNTHSTYTILGYSVHTNTIKDKINRGIYYNIEQIKEINGQLANPIDFDYIDRFYNSKKHTEIEIKIKDLKDKIRKYELEKENEKEKKDKIINKIGKLSLVELNEIYQMDEYFDTKIEGLEKVELINDLVKKGYIDDKWKHFVSPTGSSDAEIALREFKYEKIKSIDDPYFDNLPESKLIINDALIESFQVVDYSNYKFIRPDIVNYLLSNIDKDGSDMKLNKVINTIIDVFKVDTTIEYSHNEQQYDEFKLQLSQDKQVPIFEDLISKIVLNTKEEINLKQIQYINRFLTIAFSLKINLSSEILNKLLLMQISNEVVFKDLVENDMFWAYFEYLLDDLDDKKLLEYCVLTFEVKEEVEKIIDLKALVSKLNNKEYIEKNIWKYTENNIEYILNEKGAAHFASDSKAVKYICETKINFFLNNSSELERIAKTKSVVENLDIMKSCIKNYKHKYNDISIVTNEEIKMYIIEKGAFILNETNYKMLLKNNLYEAIFRWFTLTEEYIKNDSISELFEYAINTEEFSYAEKYSKNIKMQYNLPEVFRSENTLIMIKNNCIKANLENYIKIEGSKELLPAYLSILSAEELNEYELDDNAQMVMYEVLLFEERYNDINSLYVKYKSHGYQELNLRYSNELNISILIEEEISKREYAYFKTNLKAKTNEFLELFEEISFIDYLKYETPNYKKAKQNKTIIVECFTYIERIQLISRIYNNEISMNLEQIKKLLTDYELLSLFAFNKHGAGSRNKLLEFDSTGYVEEFCEILVEIGHLESYDKETSIITRKYK